VKTSPAAGCLSGADSQDRRYVFGVNKFARGRENVAEEERPGCSRHRFCARHSKTC